MIYLSNMKRIILLFIIAFLSAPMPLQAEHVNDVARKMSSPEDIEKFYVEGGFKSEYKIPDYEKTPQETLDSRYGDCKDYATLTQAILKEMDIHSEVVHIKFSKTRFGHAVCVWKDGNHYHYFDGPKLIKTEYASIDDVINKAYLNTECCTACERKLDMETGQCIDKK